MGFQVPRLNHSAKLTDYANLGNILTFKANQQAKERLESFFEIYLSSLLSDLSFVIDSLGPFELVYSVFDFANVNVVF